MAESCDSYLEVTISGRAYRLAAIELHPEDRVQEWRRLSALAQQQLGPVSLGVGAFGSIGWVAAGSLVLGAIDGLLTSASQKEGLRNLKSAQSIFEEFRWTGRLVEVERIDRLDMPHPGAWRGTAEDEVTTDLRSFTRAEQAAVFAEHGLSPREALELRVKSKVAKTFVSASDEFVTGYCLDGARIKVRWAAIETYKAVFAGKDVVVAPTPPSPGGSQEFRG